MIKQAMILSAGEGIRMRPLTLTTPKPLLSVGNKPLIVWHIDKLIASGVTQIVINARYLADKLVAFFETHSFNANIKISLETHFDEPIETAGGIAFALEQGLLHNEPFLLVNGDVWTDVGFDGLLGVELGQDLGHLCLTKNPTHHPNGDFALHNGRVEQMGERLTFAGLSVLSPMLVEGVPIGQKAPLAPLLRQAIVDGRLSGQKWEGHWVDVGTPERLNELNNFIKNNIL